MTIALNWGSGLFAAGLFVACVESLGRPDRKGRLVRAAGLSAVAGLVLAGLIYLALPTTEVRLVKSPSMTTRITLFHLSARILDERPRTREEVRQELGGRFGLPRCGSASNAWAMCHGAAALNVHVVSGASRFYVAYAT